jgi:hypothetical protein
MSSSLIGRVVLDIVRVLGAVMFVIGIVWILQGVNILPGSFMTGQIVWAERGAAAAVVGLGLLVAVNWRRPA